MDGIQKLYKVFKVIRLLNSPPAKSVQQLVTGIPASESAVYRYLKLLEKLGYPIETDSNHRKSLGFKFPKGGNGVLGPDELAYMQDMIQKFGGDSPHAENLLHKFNLNLSLIPLADALPQLHIGRIIQLVRLGINTGSCLKLCRYRSLTSNTTLDRRVEPLEITGDSRYLIAWDLDKDDQRQFKLERIEDINVLNEKVTPGRIASPMDLFGLTGTDWQSVRMTLSGTAHHLLVEEFPLSRQYIRKQGKIIIFDGPVRNWKGVGRFVLGLPGEIEVVAPVEFKDYLRERVGKYEM